MRCSELPSLFFTTSSAAPEIRYAEIWTIASLFQKKKNYRMVPPLDRGWWGLHDTLGYQQAGRHIADTAHTTGSFQVRAP
jgi:hypothetical protein